MLPSCLTVDEIRGVFAPFLDVKQLPFIPRGASEPLPAVPDVVEITEHDIDMAIKDWDTIFPEYAGLLNASVKGGGEAEANAGPY
jgi:hypothetical protein